MLVFMIDVLMVTYHTYPSCCTDDDNWAMMSADNNYKLSGDCWNWPLPWNLVVNPFWPQSANCWSYFFQTSKACHPGCWPEPSMWPCPSTPFFTIVATKGRVHKWCTLNPVVSLLLSRITYNLRWVPDNCRKKYTELFAVLSTCMVYGFVDRWWYLLTIH